MPNHAQVSLIGHVGQDPEIRSTGSGEQVANFSLATSRKRQDQEITTWWRCAVWGKRAAVIKDYVKKGDPIHVIGEPVMRTYTDKEGYEAKSLDVFVSDFTLLVGKREGAGSSGGDAPKRRPAETQQNAGGAPAGSGGSQDFDDDIPFDLYQRGMAA